MPPNHESRRRITARPNVFGEKPIIRDLRISAELMLGLLTQKVSSEAILDYYSDPKVNDIRCQRPLCPSGHCWRHVGCSFSRGAMTFLMDHCTGRHIASR